MARYNACEDLLDRNDAAGRGDKTAFVDPTRSVTYSQLAVDTRRFANVLKTLGVGREQRIALALLDTVEYPAAFLGAIRAGIVPVCLNTLLATDQYAYMLADSRAAVLFEQALRHGENIRAQQAARIGVAAGQRHLADHAFHPPVGGGHHQHMPTAIAGTPDADTRRVRAIQRFGEGDRVAVVGDRRAHV